MCFITLPGVAGTVYMDKIGDRDPDYTIQTLINDSFEDIAYYTRYNDNFTIREAVTIIWPGGVTTAPGDSPTCGWKNELCIKSGGEYTLFLKENNQHFYNHHNARD